MPERNEIWKDITEFKGIYQVSNFGRVKSLSRLAKNGNGYRRVRERIKPSHYSPALGYWVITLKNVALGKENRYYIHRLVAQAFLPNPNGCREVNHKDSNRLNAKVDNLEWVTPAQNQQHSYNTTDRKGYWTDKVTTVAIPVVAIQETSILEFPSALKCSEYFGVCLNTIRSRMRTSKPIQGHLIYSV